MKSIFLIVLLAVAKAQEGDIQDAATTMETMDESAITTSMDMDHSTEAVSRTDDEDEITETTEAEKPAKPNQLKAVVPYPIFRQALPYPGPIAFPYQQYPVVPFQYVPVVFQEDESEALARQIAASAGAHLGPFGIGFNAGASPSGLGASFGAGLGSQYTQYGYPSYGQSYGYYQPSSYYYYRAVPTVPQPQTQPQIQPVQFRTF